MATAFRFSYLFSIQLPLNLICVGVAVIGARTVCYQASMRHHIRCEEVIPAPVRPLIQQDGSPGAALLPITAHEIPLVHQNTGLEMSPAVENLHLKQPLQTPAGNLPLINTNPAAQSEHDDQPHARLIAALTRPLQTIKSGCKAALECWNWEC